jgi:hypothetical protein
MSRALQDSDNQLPPAKRLVSVSRGMAMDGAPANQEGCQGTGPFSLFKALPRDLVEMILMSKLAKIKTKHLSLLGQTSKWMAAIARSAYVWQHQFNLSRSSPWKAEDKFFLNLLGSVGHRVSSITLPMGLQLRQSVLETILIKLPFVRTICCWGTAGRRRSPPRRRTVACGMPWAPACNLGRST